MTEDLATARDLLITALGAVQRSIEAQEARFHVGDPARTKLSRRMMYELALARAATLRAEGIIGTEGQRARSQVT